MKRIFAAILGICLLISLAACGGKTVQETTPATTAAPTEAPTEATTEATNKKTFAELYPAASLYELLYNYVTAFGVEENGAACLRTTQNNANLHLIAENDILTFAYASNGSGQDHLVYELDLIRGSNARFRLMFAEGDRSATVSGSVDANGSRFTVTSEEYAGCTAEEILQTMQTCHRAGVTFIEAVMTEVGIPCSLADLIK